MPRRFGRNEVAARRIINFCCMPGLNSKLTEPIKKLSFGEDENTKNASSLGLFLADRTRGASKIPRVIFHVADGHLDSIFQSTARHTLLRKACVAARREMNSKSARREVACSIIFFFF